MEIAQHWRLKNQRLRLEGEICPHCEAKNFPPREVCPHCSNNDQEIRILVSALFAHQVAEEV